MPDQKAILNEMVRNVGENADRLRSKKTLTLFVATKGRYASGKLMVVGRAVNGWCDEWSPNIATIKEEREKIVESAYQECLFINDECPMKWVSDKWGISEPGTYTYNTKRSAFWRVIRQVAGRLGIADIETDDWPSHLIWSNLYKIAPFKGGNPSEKLCDLQYDQCVKCLKQEIRDWKPRRILFLTGLGWAKELLEDLQQIEKSKGYVEAAGELITGKHKAKVVVVPHPQGKPESQIVDEIIDAFNK
jgi:hypothetical protein